MLLYYDKSGSIISPDEFCTLFEDMEYRRVAETKLENGIWISTVWIGINQNFLDDEPPLIFETMAFNIPDSYDVEEYQERYSTLEEAIEGHTKAVEFFGNLQKL